MLSNTFPQMSCMIIAFLWGFYHVTVTCLVCYRLTWSGISLRVGTCWNLSKNFSHPFHYQRQSAYADVLLCCSSLKTIVAWNVLKQKLPNMHCILNIFLQATGPFKLKFHTGLLWHEDKKVYKLSNSHHQDGRHYYNWYKP